MYHLMLACKAMEHVKFGKEGEVIHQYVQAFLADLLIGANGGIRDIKFGNSMTDFPLDIIQC